MKDFPVFTTQYGVASLTLKEIPYRKEAFIVIQSSESPGELLDECVSFCKICGAEKIYASGHSFLERYPLHTIIFQMQGSVQAEEYEIPNMFPVTQQTVGEWRRIYNERMRNVDNASTLEAKDETRILSVPGAYFIHDCGKLLGIGWMEDDRLSAIASMSPGAGELICKAMQSISPPEIKLEVASTNHKAIKLYERLGFLKTKELSRWYRVL